jgi:hypothetical protein
VFVTLALLLGLLVIGMVVVTLYYLFTGLQTIDSKRSQTWKRENAKATVAKAKAKGSGGGGDGGGQSGRDDDDDDDKDGWDPRTRLYLPLEDRSKAGSSGAIVLVDPDLRIYDLGWKSNWRLVMGEGWSVLCPWSSRFARVPFMSLPHPKY